MTRGSRNSRRRCSGSRLTRPSQEYRCASWSGTSTVAAVEADPFVARLRVPAGRGDRRHQGGGDRGMRRAAGGSQDMGTDRDARRARCGGAIEPPRGRAARLRRRFSVTSSNGHIGSRGTAYTRAMIRRMGRTRRAAVPATCAESTPAQVITAWCEEHEVDVSADAVAELSSRLHRGGCSTSPTMAPFRDR